MKKWMLLIASALTAAMLFSSCKNNDNKRQPMRAAENTSKVSVTEKTAKQPTSEQLSTELYSAYVMDGTEKRWGYINEEGKFIIEPKYESVEDFETSGMAKVTSNGRIGLIDKSGDMVIEPQYIDVFSFEGKKVVGADELSVSYLLGENKHIIFQTKGTIDKPSCGLAAFSITTDDEQSLWGYIDTEGKVIIEPKYKWANKFINDKALVELSEGHYGIIDKKGKIHQEFNNIKIESMSEGMLIFSIEEEEYDRKYGYLTEDGEIVVDAIYKEAQDFHEGLAIVNTAKDHGNEFGVIDKSGKFIIPAKYARIDDLGKGIFAVTEKQNDYFETTYMKKALFDKAGVQQTEFKYYDIERLENEWISVTDDRNTYLVDQKGNEIRSIPKAEGIGSIKICGKLYKVEIDDSLYYLSQEGTVVWKADNTIYLDGGVKIGQKTFAPDRCMLIHYPEVSGLSDAKLQEKINVMLREKFIGDNKYSSKDGDMYIKVTDIDFTAQKNKNLLIICKRGYYYPIGAAHGYPTREDLHIDMNTGTIYTLKDLFKEDSKYKEKLAEIIEAMIKRINEELGEEIYAEAIGDFEESSGYAIEKDALHIYFYPYEIASYAAGFPEFEIGYDKVEKLIKTDGELWKSFDRDPLAKTTEFWNEIYPNDKIKIEEAMEAYENSMIDAINQNDFTLVEPWLVQDSKLYISQKQLVANLNQKKIKERLENYRIEKMEIDNFGITRIYVTENIGIQYPDKEYITKQFKWVYSAKYDYKDEKYQLTYIDKWENENQ